MSYEIKSESYGRRLPKITAEADSTDDLVSLGVDYAEGSTCLIGDTTYKLDKVSGWVIPGESDGQSIYDDKDLIIRLDCTYGEGETFDFVNISPSLEEIYNFFYNPNGDSRGHGMSYLVLSVYSDDGLSERYQYRWIDAPASDGAITSIVALEPDAGVDTSGGTPVGYVETQTVTYTVADGRVSIETVLGTFEITPDA